MSPLPPAPVAAVTPVTIASPVGPIPTTPAATTRGFGTAEFTQIGEWICEVLDAQVANPGNTSAVEQDVLKRVQDLCRRFPIYQ